MRLNHITLAADDLDAAVRFYNALFDAQLIQVKDMPLYSGSVGDVPFRIVSNQVAGVQSTANRYQWEFSVDDIHRIIADAEDAGGRQKDAVREVDGIYYAAVLDPDGNTIALVQSTPYNEAG